MIRFLARATRRAYRAYRRQLWRDRYTAYLSSPRWAHYRLRVLARDSYRCTRCGDTQSLECHHLTYERLGHERLADCVTLCHECHRAVHRRRARKVPR